MIVAVANSRRSAKLQGRKKNTDWDERQTERQTDRQTDRQTGKKHRARDLGEGVG